ncbi:MAG: ion transporter [Planctomycetaceae bacterium]|nr:ion transporter [Planctomycetaceae bacterium]
MADGDGTGSSAAADGDPAVANTATANSAIPDRVAVADLKRRLIEADRFGDEDLRARCKTLQQLKVEAVDIAARAEDGNVETLSLGGYLSSVSQWQRLCERHGLDEQAKQCRELARSAFTEAAADWKATVEDREEVASVDTLFDDLLGTAQLEADIRNRGLLEPAALTPLRKLRNNLRDELSADLKNENLDNRTLNRWTQLIADQCDHILTTADDLAPDVAAEQIRSTLLLSGWYLKNVDRRRNDGTRHLKRRHRRLRAEEQERQLQGSLESIFGRKFTGRMERLILVLICLVLGLMIAEWTMPLSEETVYWLAIVDAAACAVFLTEFGLKLTLVKGRSRWFVRHFFVDFVPSIPFGLLTAGMANSGDVMRAGRAVRFARLPRFVRYVRILRPIVRITRALGLVARGIDRLARRYGHVLNCNVILHPTQREQELFEQERREAARNLQELRQLLRDAWSRMFAETCPEDRLFVANTRIEGLQHTLKRRTIQFEESSRATSGTRDIPAEALLDRMESLEPSLVEPALGEPMMMQLARIIRILSVAPLRWLPIIRQCIPAQASLMSEADVVSTTSRRVARFLRKFHDGWFWLTDLYGTVTPSQFIDRVGGILVKSSSRPAYRLLLFGGFLILTEATLSIVEIDALEPLRAFLKRFLGTTVLVLGGVCLFVLGLGWWLQRVAREATEFYDKSVQAQFLHLMDSVRPKYVTRDAAALYERVLAADWPSDDSRSDSERIEFLSKRLRNAMFRTTQTTDNDDRFETLLPFVNRLELLYHDWIDGAMFTRSDTRTTNQLLGNTAISQLMLTSDRIAKKYTKLLSQVDLENQKSLLNGPYLWFHFIAQSVSHSVARLLVDYNRRAIPNHELPHCSESQRNSFTQWLNTDPDFQHDNKTIVEPADANSGYVTTSFTALHFLDPDPQRDQTVKEHFGEEVIARIRSDRSLLIRRTFGTLPLHLRPRSERVVNLYAAYEGWIAGGRIFLVPWFLFVVLCRLLIRLIGWVYQSVQEIRNPERRKMPIDAAQADFRVAVRKVNRIRSPVAERCVRLRAIFDPAWLGVALPGEQSTLLGTADADADIAFLRLGPATQRKIESEKRRCLSGMRWLEHSLEDGLLKRIAEQRGLAKDAFNSRQHLRAASIAVHADLNGVRAHLFAKPMLAEILHTTGAKPSLRDRVSPRFSLRAAFRRYLKTTELTELAAERSAWKSVLKNESGAAAALMAWDTFGDSVEQEGERRLGEILQHPGRITEQLLTLRMIETLTVLDVLHYREHIFKLGQYDEGHDLLSLRPE